MSSLNLQDGYTLHGPSLSGWFWAIFVIFECALIYYLFSHPMKLTFVVIALGLVILIFLKPQAGLYLSTVFAYSGIASNLLQGLFMPTVFLTAVSWLIFFLHQKTESLAEAPQNKLFVLFGALMICSTLYAANLELSFDTIYSYTKYLLFYFLIINIVHSWKSMRNLLWVLVSTGVMMFIYGVYISFFSGTIEGDIRMTSFIEDPNSYAIKLVPLTAISYILIKTEKSRLLRILSFIIFFALIVAIMLTFSRGGWLALFTVVFLIGLKEIRNKKGLFIIATFVVIGLLFFPIEMFTDRLESIGKITSDRSIVQRLRILNGGIQMFLDHPLGGVGIGNFITHMKDYAHTNFPLVAHNSYLHIAAELGIFGITLFIMLLIITLKQIRSCWIYFLKDSDSKFHHYPFGILVAVLGFMVHSLFLSEHLNVALFLLIGLAVVMTNMKPHTSSSK